MAGKYDGAEKYMFADAYNILTKYINMSDTDAYWEALIGELNDFKNKYCRHILARNLAESVQNDIQLKLKGIQGEAFYSDYEKALENKKYIGINSGETRRFV